MIEIVIETETGIETNDATMIVLFQNSRERRLNPCRIVNGPMISMRKLLLVICLIPTMIKINTDMAMIMKELKIESIENSLVAQIKEGRTIILEAGRGTGIDIAGMMDLIGEMMLRIEETTRRHIMEERKLKVVPVDRRVHLLSIDRRRDIAILFLPVQQQRIKNTGVQSVKTTGTRDQDHGLMINEGNIEGTEDLQAVILLLSLPRQEEETS